MPAVGTVLVKRDRDGRARCECTVEETGARYGGTLYRGGLLLVPPADPAQVRAWTARGEDRRDRPSVATEPGPPLTLGAPAAPVRRCLVPGPCESAILRGDPREPVRERDSSAVEIHRGRRHVVLRVERADGGTQIRKVLRPHVAVRYAPARLRREHDILRLLAAGAVAHVARAVALEEVDGAPVLVLEDAGPRNLGERLNRRALPMELFLDMTIQLAQIVADLHRHQVIHRDINPSNLVVGADGRSLTLIDFGLATHVVAVAQAAAAGELAGTLPYLAPEQTGRVDRPLDHRADLYALGATLYEMLTGGPPFRCDDPAELVHAHLAWTPAPPTVRNPAVPEAVSRIVVRLLAKMPEQRYQTGDALLADLREARRQWEATGTVAPFELGRFDLAEGLLAPTSLRGRESELAALTAALARAQAGASELVLLSGAAGIGKSRLAEALRVEAEGRSRFLAGKSNPLQGNLPYGALASPLRSFLRALSREPAHVVDRWRVRIEAAFGAGAGVLADVLPEIGLIVGALSPPPEVGPVAAENRFLLALQALVQVLGEPGVPLVLFLDDLQWADAPSVAAIERLVSGPDAHHLLVIGASRPEAVGADQLLTKTLAAARAAGATVQVLALEPLDEPEVAGLVAEALRSTAEAVEPLAALVRRKTAGNPFFADRFLRLLHRSGLLFFDVSAGAWRWDLAGAEALTATDNVVDLLVGAVAKLPPETVRMLAAAACMGARIDLALLADVIDQPIDETARRLWSALRDGWLIAARSERPGAEGVGDVVRERASYRFVHDRVQQAAYALLDDLAKQRTHLAIGRRLVAGGEPATDEALYEMVDQLNRGAALITDQEERLALAALDRRAAERASASGAFGPSLEYARQGIAVLPARNDESDRPLWLALHRQAAEGAFQQGDSAAGEALFARALELAETPVEKAELHAARLSVENMRSAWEASLRWGREGLRLLGFPLPEGDVSAPLARELAAVRERLSERPVAALVDLPAMRDPPSLTAMDLARRLNNNSQLDERLWSLLQVRMVTLSLERGNGPASALGYHGLGVVLRETGADAPDLVDALGRLSVDLAQRSRDPITEALVLTNFATMSNHWQAPLRSNVPLMRQAMQVGLESGDFVVACWASVGVVSNLFHSGGELARTESECTAALRLAQRTRQTAVLPFLAPYRETVLRLQTSLERPTVGVGPPPAEPPTSAPPATAAVIEHPMAVVAPCILRDRALARRRFSGWRQLLQFRPRLRGSTAAPWFTLYISLTAALIFDECSPEERAALLELLDENHRMLERWAERCPENFRHRAGLVAAERARLAGQLDRALPLYDRSMEWAQAQGFVHEMALACELAGRCRLAQGLAQAANAYLEKARAAYARWGAAAKVEALDEEFPALGVAPPRGLSTPAISSSSDDSGVAALDLQSLLKAKDTLSGEVVLDRLLEKLIAVSLEVAGARYGALILDERGQLAVRARGAVAEEVALEPMALGVARGVPRTLVEHVFGRGEPVALEDAARRGDFSGDPYFAASQTKSALAVPIRQHGRTVGVLYLENDLATHAFPPERVRVLGLLSAQIASSLENSRLFEDLKVEVADRTRAEQAVRFLAESSAALAESLDYRTTLADVARLAVPFLGDWCTVDVVEADGRLAPVAAVHVDPAKQALLVQLRGDYPVVSDEHLLSAQTLRTRSPVLVAEIIEERVTATVTNPRHLELLRAIGVRSLLAVPLVARGRPLGAITLAVSVSSRRYGPADVALAQELARRAAIAVDNARLYQDAQQAVRLRDEFLTVASHELNTPVAALHLSVAPFSGGATPPPDTIPKLLAIVDRQTTRLANLIGELLDVSRVQAGAFQMHIGTVDLTDLVRQTVDRSEGALGQARCAVALDLDDGVVGRWDRAALERVLTNLLSNAMKFGAGHPIEVTLRGDPETARLIVRDHGMGIDRAILPRIFDRFARGVSAEHYGGLGLGLYIARVIVAGLGGSISVESAPEQGAAFTVQLPRAGP